MPNYPTFITRILLSILSFQPKRRCKLNENYSFSESSKRYVWKREGKIDENLDMKDGRAWRKEKGRMNRRSERKAPFPPRDGRERTKKKAKSGSKDRRKNWSAPIPSEALARWPNCETSHGCARARVAKSRVNHHTLLWRHMIYPDPWSVSRACKADEKATVSDDSSSHETTAAALN